MATFLDHGNPRDADLSSENLLVPHVRPIGNTPLVTVSVSFTRPGNTDAYAANDAVSNSTSAPSVLTFAGMARAVGGSGYITKARLFTGQAANIARFRLHLFHTAPTAINDNAAHTILAANQANRVGQIVFPACSTAGSGSDAANSIAVPGTYLANLPLGYVCESADDDLYGLLETLDAFTPASAQTFFLELTAERH